MFQTKDLKNQLTLPSSVEGERFLLGALLLGEQKIWDLVMEFLKPSDFYKNSHQEIFYCMEKIYKNGSYGDILAISEELKKQQKLESIGGHSYLAELIEESSSAISVKECSHIIREKALLRTVIQLCSEFRRRAFSQDFDRIDAFIDSLEKELFTLTHQFGQKELLPVNVLVKQGLEWLEEMSQKKLGVTGISSSFTELDYLTSGFQPGEFTVIAARPSMGKTALSLNIALSASLDNKKIAFFSIEMANEQVLMRLLSLAGRIPLSNLRTGQMSAQNWDQVVQAASKLNEVQFFIDDSSSISPFEIRSRARRLKARHGLDLLIVDYLQLMSLKSSMESREREVSEISKLLKSMAKELELPVIALSQLNRGVEARTNRRPLLSDLRESGSIEQDADLIMMLYRDDYYNKESSKKGEAEIILSKHRNGPTGTVNLKWNPIFGHFDNNIPNENEAPAPTAPAF